MRSFDAWVDHPGYAITPQGILATFRLAEMGDPQRQCDLIDDLVENDATLRNLFEQREQSVAGKPWVVQAGGASDTEELGARIMFESLRQLPMVQVYQHLLAFNRYGWSACEIDWGVRNIEGRDWIVPVWLAPVPARRFKISSGFGPALSEVTGVDELRLYADAKRPHGDELKPSKWIVLRRSGPWLARSGLMRTAAWPAMAKRLGFRDWLVYSQRFGMPLPIAKYKAESGDEDLKTAEEVVSKIGSDGGAVMPDSIDLEFFDATRGNVENSKAHGGLIAHCNAEMAKLINGSTLANDNAGSGGASYALGEVHASTRWDAILHDTEMLQEAFRTQLAAPLMHFNGLAGAAPLLRVQVVRDLQPEQRALIAVRMANQLGIGVSISQMRQELGFREPAGNDDKAPGMKVESFPIGGGGSP
ncbi:MAG: DUF935 family protein [Kofleriaceae bacterium]